MQPRSWAELGREDRRAGWKMFQVTKRGQVVGGKGAGGGGRSLQGRGRGKEGREGCARAGNGDIHVGGSFVQNVRQMGD